MGEEPEGSSPRDESAESDRVPAPDEQPLRWYLNSSHWLVVASRDVLTALAVVAGVGVLLLAISGTWPPLVAVESGSMEPNIEQGDLVFVVAADRFTADGATADGVVTHEQGKTVGHEKFGKAGSVIIFQPNGADTTPIIHRAMFYVEEGENWVETADPAYLNGDTCADFSTCPADHAGYITKGDNNPYYDQAQGKSNLAIVAPEWIEGKALVDIPYLGQFRLALS